MKKIFKNIFKQTGYQITKVTNIENENSENELRLLLGFEADSLPFLEEGKSFLANLKNKQQSNFFFEGGLFKIQIQDLNFIVNSWEELLILNEVFIEGVYNFSLNEDFILIDIGMNVGITSLYFSNKVNCKKIYAYEPFQKTLEYSKVNFSLNVHSSKITVFNYGLGYPERSLMVDYNESFKGSVGINGVAKYIFTADNISSEIIIKDAALIYDNIKKHNDKVVLKIDCEGAEYEILNRLNEKKILREVDCLLIEWHLKGPQEIKELLLINGFKILSFHENSLTIGMIYAFK